MWYYPFFLANFTLLSRSLLLIYLFLSTPTYISPPLVSGCKIYIYISLFLSRQTQETSNTTANCYYKHQHSLCIHSHSPNGNNSNSSPSIAPGLAPALGRPSGNIGPRPCQTRKKPPNPTRQTLPALTHQHKPSPFLFARPSFCRSSSSHTG
ncbi:hypothetical protein NCAS_0G04100 [Naumovozyma castellii]|uniref:Uncharacterized protein n=1 Tax=Naumovozyma castellii TaxID=27288 RepID=G0VHJ0_NAUCA|nr:hypothetical protein NCAS_0G04100 [Naumovozyma castellii CBS 4309]CCC71297.1 hypothetical protein NCAS_0G04100 [Naumovozyma castellii CBS 4309]